MKQITTFALSCILWITSLGLQAQNYDYLASVSDTGSGVTTNNSQNWTDLVSVTIDVTNINQVFLSAGINMRTDGSSNNGREANYNIYRSDDATQNSGVIKRQMRANSEPGVESWGVGTLVHIFDVSNVSGNKTFVLEHSNKGGTDNGRNVFSYARLTAIAMTTQINHNDLNTDVKRLSTYDNTTSSSYSAISGLVTDSLTLPVEGDIYVAASIDSKSNTGNTEGEYRLEYSTDNGATYTSMGKSVKRTMVNTWDDGIITLVGLLQEPGVLNSYKFRVAHRRNSGSGTISSGNANLIAIALSHPGGGYFPTFYSENDATGASVTGAGNKVTGIVTNSFTTEPNIGANKVDMFVSTQYLVSASNLNQTANPPQRLRGENQLYITSALGTVEAEPYYRYIADNSMFGAGGFMGLAENLDGSTNYTLGMEHEIEHVSNPDGVADETLTTSQVLMIGFRTFDKARNLWSGGVSGSWENASNWAYGVVPSANTDAVIASGAFSPVLISGHTYECRNLILETGAVLDISAGASLTVGTAIQNDGTITIENNGSLVQTNSGANTNTGQGTFEMKRTGNNSGFVYNIWSSPMQEASVTSTFSNANPCDIWVFEGAGQRWNHDYAVGYSTSCYGNNVVFTANDVISGGDGVMDAGRGYFVPGDVAPTRSFNGQVNNGTITVPIQATTLGNPGGTDWGDDDWNLIGNPYPSAISAASFWSENSLNNARIITGLYFWDEADTAGGYNQNSDYASWNLAGGVNSGNSSKIPTGQIASGQGFWVVANTSSNVVFTNSMRTGLNDQFFKNGVTDNHNLWVSCTSPSGYQNNILVGFNPNSTDGEDANYDAHKLIGNAHIKLSSVIDNKEYVIQSLAMIPIQQTKIIPLTVSSDEYGDHVFANYKMQNISDNYQIYIRDNYLGITKDLRKESMVVSLDPNVNYTHRFELVVVNEMLVDNGGSQTTHVTSINEVDLSATRVIQNESELIVTNTNGFSGLVEVVDITGKVIWSKSQKTEVNSLSIDISSFNNGVYILHVTNQENQVYRTKFMKVK
tara:strand:- start:489 stop:3602 length:3114 start_codon:yes stop_codon:yes gene_type:complete